MDLSELGKSTREKEILDIIDKLIKDKFTDWNNLEWEIKERLGLIKAGKIKGSEE